jgi:hypothetical protein
MNMGSVSTATMRAEDLIPSFLWELEHQEGLTAEHQELVAEINKRMVSEDYYESENADYDLEALFEALDEYSLPGFYFGAHPGDGADFGYWLSETFAEDFDGLKVNGLDEVPAGFSGEVLEVNDHGNMTLWAYDEGADRPREIWAIV